jgi:hypothetical protein
MSGDEYGAGTVGSGQEQRHERQRGTCGHHVVPLGQLLPPRARRRDTRPMVPSFDKGKSVGRISEDSGGAGVTERTGAGR